MTQWLGCAGAHRGNGAALRASDCASAPLAQGWKKLPFDHDNSDDHPLITIQGM